MTFLLIACLGSLALALAAVVVIDRAARQERCRLLDRIQAPDAVATQAWANTTTPPPPGPVDGDIDREWARTPESLLGVPDDLSDRFFTQEA